MRKFRKFASEVIDEQRRDMIERLVLGIENVEDVSVLEDLLARRTLNPIE